MILLITEPGSWRARSNQQAPKNTTFCFQTHFFDGFDAFWDPKFRSKKIQNFRFLDHLNRHRAPPFGVLAKLLPASKIPRNASNCTKNTSCYLQTHLSDGFGAFCDPNFRSGKIEKLRFFDHQIVLEHLPLKCLQSYLMPPND